MSETDLCFRATPQELRRKPSAPKPVVRTKRSARDNRNAFPIPKGDTPYARAKRAEYIDRNLVRAEFFYKQAIRKDDRADSSVKDLAGILHQQGRTAEACRLLEANKHLFTSDHSKFENLLQNLQRQVTPSGNCLNKALKVSGLTTADTPADVCKLFQNSTRVQSLSIEQEAVESRLNVYALKFTSHSAARKTLESFHDWDQYKVEWVSVTGEVVCDACHNKDKSADFRVLAPIAFSYSLFLRDPESFLYALPVDSQLMYSLPCKSYEDDMEIFVGESLLDYILNLPLPN
jgi:hypothetical protein